MPYNWSLTLIATNESVKGHNALPGPFGASLHWRADGTDKAFCDLVASAWDLLLIHLLALIATRILALMLMVVLPMRIDHVLGRLQRLGVAYKQRV